MILNYGMQAVLHKRHWHGHKTIIAYSALESCSVRARALNAISTSRREEKNKSTWRRNNNFHLCAPCVRAQRRRGKWMINFLFINCNTLVGHPHRCWFQFFACASQMMGIWYFFSYQDWRWKCLMVTGETTRCAQSRWRQLKVIAYEIFCKIVDAVDSLPNGNQIIKNEIWTDSPYLPHKYRVRCHRSTCAIPYAFKSTIISDKYYIFYK